MPPKRTTEPPLTEPERALLDSTARVFTAIQYKEGHPGEDFTFYADHLAMEMASGIPASHNILYY